MAFNLAHIADTAVMILAAYLVGCVLGYGARWAAYLGRGTRQVVPAPAPAPEAAALSGDKPHEETVRRPRSNAARLAAAADDPVAGPPRKKPVRARRSKVDKVDPRPPTLPEPLDGAADNLKRIKGIGPKIEASLNAMGVFHLHQIAAWTEANIDWVESQLAFKGRIRREKWVDQAAELTRIGA